MPDADPYSLDKLTAEARRLAADYRRTTGKSLPLSGEIAVNDAIRLLRLEAPEKITPGCDALKQTPDGAIGVQIKGRVVMEAGKGAPRIGQLKLEQNWQETVLVLMDEDYEPFEIYAADKDTIESALRNKSPNKRGAMTVAQFKVIGECVWSRAADCSAGAQ